MIDCGQRATYRKAHILRLEVREQQLSRFERNIEYRRGTGYRPEIGAGYQYRLSRRSPSLGGRPPSRAEP